MSKYLAKNLTKKEEKEFQFKNDQEAIDFFKKEYGHLVSESFIFYKKEEDGSLVYIESKQSAF